MPKENFNPIAQLPIPPGIDIRDDEAITNGIDSTYPPINEQTKDTKKPQIEIRLKGTDSNKSTNEKEKNDHLTIVRALILVFLIAILLFGIFLTLNFIPKIATNVSNFSKSFTSIFVSKKTIGPAPTSTPAKIPAYIPLVATSTTQMTSVVSTTTNQLTTTQSASTYQPKALARLTATILSTNIVGNRTIVRFNIQNVGGMSSGQWSFSATLPSSVTPKYYSEVQDSLTPQSGVVYTLGFTAEQNAQYNTAQITLYTQQGNSNSY